MGCGGIFDIFGYLARSRRGCGYTGSRYARSYNDDDIEEKMILLKRMLAEGRIDNEGYYNYKQKILNGEISFEELMSINHMLGK